MKAKKIFLTTIIGLMVFFLAIGIFFYSSDVITAGDKIDKIKDKDYINSIRSEDSIEVTDGKTKTYISGEKRLKLEDSDGIILEMKLLTPYDNRVGVGESMMVAEWLLINFNDKTKIFEKIDSYNIKDDYKVKSKSYIWKYLVETEITNCYDVSKINNKTKENITSEVCSDYIQRDWIKFSNAKDLPNKNIRIGLFTNTIEGEHIEFVPTIEGLEILEWASFLADNLAAYYKLNESSGAVLDALGANNGVNIGGTPNQPGLISTSYSFDGSSKGIDLPESMFNVGNMTFSTWINITTSSNGDGLWEFDNSDNPQIRVVIDVDGKALALAWQGGEQVAIRSIDPIPTNEWVHIVFTHQTNNAALYLNGVWQSGDNTTTVSGATSNQHSMAYLDPTGATTITGGMDETSFYSYAINQEVVTGLYNSGMGKTFPLTAICTFSGFVFDEDNNAIVGANITVWNQFDVSLFFETTTVAGGAWEIDITNSTNTYMVGAYFNNTIIGQLKPFVSGSC